MVTRSCCFAYSGSWCLTEVPSAGFGVGVDKGSSPTLIPDGASVAVSLPLDQIIPDLIDHQAEGKLSTQGFTRQTVPVVPPLGLKGSSLRCFKYVDVT